MNRSSSNVDNSVYHCLPLSTIAVNIDPRRKGEKHAVTQAGPSLGMPLHKVRNYLF